MKNRIVFIVCCKEPFFVKENIERLNKFYPDSTKIIVDSDSSDKSYMNFDFGENVLIEDIANKNFEIGAYVKAFKKYKSIGDVFVCIQDSMYIEKEIKEIDGIEENEVFRFQDDNSGWTHGLKEMQDFYKKNPNFMITEINFPMVIWNCFIIKRNAFEKVIESDIFKNTNLPDDKKTSCAFERVLTPIFIENELQLKVIDQSSYKKIFGGRS